LKLWERKLRMMVGNEFIAAQDIQLQPAQLTY